MLHLHLQLALDSKQGDQIGRIFACWAIIFLVQFFKNYRSNPNFWAAILSGKKCINYNKIWGGLQFKRFFQKTILVILFPSKIVLIKHIIYF
jgi:hypothetical protein